MSTPSHHTPAPWVSAHYGFNIGKRHIQGFMICTEGKSLGIITGNGPEHYVCEMTQENPHVEANALLIAAAPDLLDGCNALLGLLQLLAGRDDIPSALLPHLTEGHRIEEACRAVRKANGAK